MPYALQFKFKTELNRVESLNIINKVDSGVKHDTDDCVLKLKGHVKICKDFNVIGNKQCDLTHYILFYINKIFERLFKNQIFVNLDLFDAYLLIELDDESKCRYDYLSPMFAYV